MGNAEYMGRDSEKMIADDEKNLKAAAKKKVKDMRKEAERAMQNWFADAEKRLAEEFESKIFGGKEKKARKSPDLPDILKPAPANEKNNSKTNKESEESDDDDDADEEKKEEKKEDDDDSDDDKDSKKESDSDDEENDEDDEKK